MALCPYPSARFGEAFLRGLGSSNHYLVPHFQDFLALCSSTWVLTVFYVFPSERPAFFSSLWYPHRTGSPQRQDRLSSDEAILGLWNWMSFLGLPSAQWRYPKHCTRERCYFSPTSVQVCTVYSHLGLGPGCPQLS